MVVTDSYSDPMAQHTVTRIRRFRREDLGAVLAVEAQAFPKTAFSMETLLQYADVLPDTFVVIETGDEIVGYVIFDRGGHIHSTAVLTSHRRMGLGAQLFAYAVAQTNGRLWLEVRSKNTGAIAFYRAMGMKVKGTAPNYYGDDDALIMALDASA
jgi:ribosomal-protein-alanine N-acetyltransferase